MFFYDSNQSFIHMESCRLKFNNSFKQVSMQFSGCINCPDKSFPKPGITAILIKIILIILHYVLKSELINQIPDRKIYYTLRS